MGTGPVRGLRAQARIPSIGCGTNSWGNSRAAITGPQSTHAVMAELKPTRIPRRVGLTPVNFRKLSEYGTLGAKSVAQQLQDGFKLGVAADIHRISRAEQRLRPEHYTEVERIALREHVAKALAKGQYLDVTDTWRLQMPWLYRAPLVPVHQADKIRPCHHLSYGSDSTNVLIPEHLKRLEGAIEDIRAVRLVLVVMGDRHGWHRILLSKFDIRAAYRLVPIDPEDWMHQGCEFEGRVYIDIFLSFGGASAPRIFGEVAAAVMNAFKAQISDDLTSGDFVAAIRRYVDDIIIVTLDSETERICDAFKEFMAGLNIALKESKEETAARRLVYLGVLIDLDDQTLRVNPAKVPAVVATMREAVSAKQITRRQAVSLLGKLQFMSTHTPSMKWCLTSMYRMLKGGRQVAALTEAMSMGFERWIRILTLNPGVPISPEGTDGMRVHTIFTDASGRGLGAYWPAKDKAISHMLDDHMCIAKVDETKTRNDVSMMFLELLAVLAVFTEWAGELGTCHLVLHIDNMGALGAVRSENPGKCKTDQCRAVLAAIEEVSALHGIVRSTVYVSSEANVNADALSRDEMHRFQGGVLKSVQRCEAAMEIGRQAMKLSPKRIKRE